jgi:hypothetical protein
MLELVIRDAHKRIEEPLVHAKGVNLVVVRAVEG